jgi:hypothetical protein
MYYAFHGGFAKMLNCTISATVLPAQSLLAMVARMKNLLLHVHKKQYLSMMISL